MAAGINRSNPTSTIRYLSLAIHLPIRTKIAHLQSTQHFHIDVCRYVDKSLKIKRLTSIVFDNLLSNTPETSIFHRDEGYIISIFLLKFDVSECFSPNYQQQFDV
jgi:hypothetical protein